MTTPASVSCHEIAIFRALDGVSHNQMLSALRDLDAWLGEQSGFLTRTIRFDREHAQWIDLVEWTDRESARAAMQRASDASCVAALSRVIDMANMLMLHGEAV